ncbi:MAG TPA: hypothetical protein VFV33_00235, partial [Gemmatimonadaceae bacterium]|nr:hypothetical protein [Gemmatimonadaceae bacterium]
NHPIGLRERHDMATKHGFPYAELEFDAKGKFGANQLKAALETLRAPGLTDVLVLSHGWNNDIADARKWYGEYLKHLRAEVDARRVPGIERRALGVVAIFWPSKKFADSELVPGNANAIGASVTRSGVRKQLALLASAFPDKASKAKFAAADKLLDRIESDVAAQRKFVDLLRGFWPTGKAGADALPAAGAGKSGDQVLQLLAPPILDLPTAKPGGAGRGGATSIGGAGRGVGGTGGAGGASRGEAANLFGSVLDGVRNALNMTTYFTMKERAGIVGANGLAVVVQRIRGEFPALKLHLAGHSFGGRVVTACVNALPKGAASRVDSLFLMQAAFSHYGMAQKYDGTSNGLFRSVISDRKVAGPIYITYTAKDKAVGLAYPLASRLGGQVAAGLGDENDKYGGIGRNGAQKTPEVTPHELLPVTQQYAFNAGGVYNLDANAVITGHSDICRPEVAHALASAIAST